MGIENTEITSNEHGKQRCYMIDFGLARRFLGADGRQREVISQLRKLYLLT